MGRTNMLCKVEKATPHDDSLDEKRIGGGDSDKYGAKEDTQVIMDVGDVYEDVRTIDLDENGKEKPIGACCCWQPFKVTHK